MVFKKLAVGTAVLAMAACQMQKAEAKAAAISPNSTDDEKFAYMLGAQFGGQNFTMIPKQLGEELNEDAVVQGVRDNIKALRDTSAKIQLVSDSLQALVNRYNVKARERAEAIRPDSATLAKLGDDQTKILAYVDSVGKAQPVTKAAPSTGAAVKIDANSSDNLKFSYFIGLQFANQLNGIGKQFETDLNENYFLLGVKDAVAKIRDTTFVMPLPEDSLKAVGERYNKRAQDLREAAVKKQQEEMDKLKADIAPLRGDTLSNGMPQKMNFKVKATGVTLKASDISSFGGKPLFVFYFSSTCGHCQHAAPQILEIAKEFSGAGLTTMAIASGSNQKTGIRKFMDNAKWDETINVMWDESRQFGELYSDGYVPKVYLVNPDGSYKLYTSFENQKDELKAEIAALLKGTPVKWVLEAPAAEEAPAAAPVAAPAADTAKAAAPAKAEEKAVAPAKAEEKAVAPAKAEEKADSAKAKKGKKAKK